MDNIFNIEPFYIIQRHNIKEDTYETLINDNGNSREPWCTYDLSYAQAEQKFLIEYSNKNIEYSILEINSSVTIE